MLLQERFQLSIERRVDVSRIEFTRMLASEELADSPCGYCKVPCAGAYHLLVAGNQVGEGDEQGDRQPYEFVEAHRPFATLGLRNGGRGPCQAGGDALAGQSLLAQSAALANGAQLSADDAGELREFPIHSHHTMVTGFTLSIQDSLKSCTVLQDVRFRQLELVGGNVPVTVDQLIAVLVAATAFLGALAAVLVAIRELLNRPPGRRR